MKKLDIIYEDKDFLVVNKPTKLLTIGNNKEMYRTLYREVREYIRKKNQKVFIVHRLDKDTSGIVLFAKNEKLKFYLQDNWNDLVKREYYAVVKGVLKDKKGVLENYLIETKTLDVLVSRNKKGKLAKLNYEVVKENKNYSLVKIDLKSGRRNQIRAQFDYIGHSILGDKKYGSGKDNVKRLYLHASYLSFDYNGKNWCFVSKLPKEFDLIFVK